MKHLSAAFIFGFLILAFCPAQSQTGNASYNQSKTGLTISHSSLSFNTHVRITNLSNNKSVDAVVNGRIPISPERIADISREAGDALGMSRTGMTLVRIEELALGTVQNVEIPVPAPLPVPSPPPAPAAASPPAVTQVLPIQTITDVQYVPVPGPAQTNCCSSPLLPVILLLLVLIIILLVVILILILRRLLLWPWHYQVWYRRHLLYAKKHRP
ncbi:MAG: hypothetical protein LBP74_09790 [Treponema sp.]|nr:hypothetical protein [Treponema sp.]